MIETERLRLRRLTLDDRDAGFMLRLVNDPGWLRNIGDRNVRSTDDARRYIQKTIDMYERLGFGSWVAEVKETGEPIGTCGLVKRDAIEDVEVGYALLPEYRGRGYAIEGARGTLDYAWKVLRLPRVAAIVTPANKDSIKVLEAAGLRYVKQIVLPNATEPISFYLASAPFLISAASSSAMEGGASGS